MIRIPEHLKEHIAVQDYSLYTDIDHASWRYIMRVSKKFFSEHAHRKYIDGLEQTGITTDYIPRISEMDEKLKKFGWRAVTVTGFIPPAVFLEFQSLGILPIACDMRRLEHLEYTPSPDIVHEAAGHAPIIADPAYASYLKKFGEIARKVIFAKEDLAVYEAIKYLSDIKEDPTTTTERIEEAYQKLKEAYGEVRYVSEAAQLSRLGWWTIEYGLVKNKNKYKIYGAGLLSSVGESYSAIMDKVKKVPLTINCVKVDYDITKPQPQLFYVKSFSDLKKTIDQLANRMAYKLGGLPALKKAQIAGTVTTAELDSGVQVSGVLTKIIEHKKRAVYLQYTGPTQLAFQDQELEGHSARYHAQGFGTPVGPIKKLKKAPQSLTTKDLKRLGFVGAQAGEIVFQSGVIVRGVLRGVLQKNKKYLILAFANCTVTFKGETLFQPEWGTFDMVCGSSVRSVYGGAADRGAYLRATQIEKSKAKHQTSNMTVSHAELLPLYQTIRKLREQKIEVGESIHLVVEVAKKLRQSFPDDWLLRVEILELLEMSQRSAAKGGDKIASELSEQIQKELVLISKKSKTLKTLIHRGLELFLR